MKTKILATTLVISFLFNIAGLVFFIYFLKLYGHYKSIRHERNLLAQNLSSIHATNIVNDLLSSDRIYKRTFASVVDGQEDTYGFLPPQQAGNPENVLTVYLHGMGSNYLEPFIDPAKLSIADAITQQNSTICFLSLNYRRDASWGNDLALSDITQNIRATLQQYPFKKIVLMGTSMGGCVALNYAAVAPADIKAKIVGVVSVESAGDLAALYHICHNPAVAPALITFGGTPETAPGAYQQKSFLSHIDKLTPGIKVAVVSAKDDHVIPAKFQKDIVDALNDKGFPVKLFEVDGGHGRPEPAIYLQGLNYVLGHDS